MSKFQAKIGLVGLLMLGTACAAEDITEEFAEDGAVISASEESVAAAEQALASCGWGGGDFVRAGFFNSDNRLDVVSPNGGTVNSYYGGQPFVYAARAVTNAWGGAGYTWAADFTGDGLTDLASANGGNIYMKLATATGVFSSTTWLVPNSWGGAGFTF